MPKLSDGDANVVFIPDKNLTRALAEALLGEHQVAAAEWGHPPNNRGLQPIFPLPGDYNDTDEPCDVCKLLDVYDQTQPVVGGGKPYDK